MATIKLYKNIINKCIIVNNKNTFSTCAILLSHKEIDKSKLVNEDFSRLEEINKKFKEIDLKEIIQIPSTSDMTSTSPSVVVEKLAVLDTKTYTSESTTISESFPWLIDKEGNFIDLASKVNLVDSITLISNFLEQKYNISNVPKIKLSEMLKPLQDKENVTVYDLYVHVSDLYRKGSLKENLLEPITSNMQNNNETIANYSLNESKPLGNFGDITLNEVVTQIRDLKWDLVLNSAKFTIHAAPMIINVVGYGLIMKGYMNTVHNRPFPTGLSSEQLVIQRKLRNRNLAIFSFLGAPLILICLRKTSLGLKDLTSIEVNSINNNLSAEKNIQTSGLLLLLSKLNKKMPNWLKYMLNIILISMILLNLIGFNSLIEFLNNIFYLKIFAYFLCSLVILYQLLNLYFLHKFIINKNINISPVLPEFLINWLNDLKLLSLNNESYHYFKNSSYIQIIIYLLIIVLVSIIL
jgi:hypothetical protein